MTDDLVARLPDHERIWLQNAEDAKNQGEGRLWCEDKVWPDDYEDGEPTEYIRADLFAAAEARVRELEAKLAEAYERAAEVADRPVIGFSDGAVEAARYIAAAIRKLAQEVKHEAD